jgi:hypothetical protein
MAPQTNWMINEVMSIGPSTGRGPAERRYPRTLGRAMKARSQPQRD